ncbi:aldehyde dehydrogenase family protein, partial [Enterobacter kobei]|uniref:aldehyde dehydrogenase family protein n=1 Tax=Enterobacter kobei TaxID=208224 RepID=UPI002FF82EB3
ALGGAKTHCILRRDADGEGAATDFGGAGWGGGGERCGALGGGGGGGKKTADDLCARLEKQIAALRVGPGLDQTPENEMGPLISSAHRSKVLGYIDSGEAQGATLRVDGRSFSVQGHEQGYFVGPTLFDNVTPEMTIYKEEIFGPVLSVVRVADYASAMDLINRHEYGNGSAIFTRDGGCARRFCEEVQAGMVGVNVPIPVPMAFHSFGGWKRSIFGALNVHGNDGVRFYTRMKTITARWPEMQQETGAAFSMPTLG